MSSRTTNLNLVKPSSDENVSLPVINGNYDTLDTEVAARVKTADIQNNLTSTATNKPLSAAQGKALSDTIATLSTLIDRFIKSDVYPTDNTDVDSIKENSFRCVNSTASHNPISKVSYLLTVRYNASRVTQLLFNPDDGFLWRGWNGSSWSAWIKKCSSNNLYTGIASDLTGNTTYTMGDSYTNYTYLLIVFISNVENTSILIPTSLISSNKGFVSSIFEANNPGVAKPVSEWNYCAYCRVSFPTTTTFNNSGCYTNQNLTLRVNRIIGLNL